MGRRGASELFGIDVDVCGTVIDPQRDLLQDVGPEVSAHVPAPVWTYYYVHTWYHSSTLSTLYPVLSTYLYPVAPLKIFRF